MKSEMMDEVRNSQDSILCVPSCLGAFAVLIAVLLSGCAAQKKISGAQAPPNIVFILADDLGYGDLGAYGQRHIQTPHLDRMAGGGMKFTSFYAGSTVCAPSRASLMTGQHTGHVSVRGNGEFPLLPADTILPQVLKKKGYVNGMAGKWGLGLKHTSGAPERKGWDFFAGHLHHVEGHYQKPDSAWQLVKGVSTRVKLPEGLYANEWFNRSALQFIRENRQRPFFLYVSYTLPHAELLVPPAYLKPYLNSDGSSRFTPETAHPSGRHYGPQPYPKAAYAAMVSQVDDYVGQILAELRAQGLEENTLVIFTSDNGTHVEGGRTLSEALDFFQSSGPFRGTKRDLYEGGIRVPFIAYWKGKISPGSTSDYAGAFWDLLPTFAELAGTGQPKGDGVSFAGHLLGEKAVARPGPLYWEFYEGGFKQAVRAGQWKAVRFWGRGLPVRTELYDLFKDPGEKNDLSVQHPEKVKELEALMDRERAPSDNPKFQIH